MRNLSIAGVVFILVGLWLIIWPPTFVHRENAFRFGNFQASIAERRPLPGWVGGTALGAGVALVVLGVLRRS